MDLSGTSYFQVRLEQVAPLRVGDGSSKVWLWSSSSSSTCTLTGSGCCALCKHMQKMHKLGVEHLCSASLDMKIKNVLLLVDTDFLSSFFIPFWCWPVGSRMGFETLAPQGWKAHYQGNWGILVHHCSDHLSFWSWTLGCKTQVALGTPSCLLKAVKTMWYKWMAKTCFISVLSLILRWWHFFLIYHHY